MKKIFSAIVAAAIFTTSIAGAGVSSIKQADKPTKEAEKKVEPSSAIQTNRFQYNGPNGGGANDEWQESSSWSPTTEAPCPGDGEACMIQVPAGQTLQQFLDSKSSYTDLLADEEHVEQRAP